MTPEQFELLVRVDERQSNIIDLMNEHLEMDRETHADQRKRIESRWSPVGQLSQSSSGTEEPNGNRSDHFNLRDSWRHRQAHLA
jgi:hypothetical protein